MLQEDTDDLFKQVESRHALDATVWTSPLPVVILEKAPQKADQMLALWPSRGGGARKRSKVIREDGAEVFEFDRNVPILEWMPSKIVEHKSTPALLQGRLYLFATNEDAAIENVFRTATNLVRKSYRPCPVKSFGGYVGPAAMEWFENGGILLPMFNPPHNAHWEQLLNEQHVSQQR